MTGGTTETYELYKKALGDKMLNDKFDQIKTSDNTWGLVDTDAGTKGYSGTATRQLPVSTARTTRRARP